MLKILAAGFIGYYIGKRTLPVALADVQALQKELERLVAQAEAARESQAIPVQAETI